MSTPQTPPVAPAAQTELEKIWTWIKAKVTIVEDDLAKIIGSQAAQNLETIGKNLLDSWIGPLAMTAMAEATDVATGTMSISKAVSNLVNQAKTSGKSLTSAAAVQTIALLQNALPTKADPTVTPAP